MFTQPTLNLFLNKGKKRKNLEKRQTKPILRFLKIYISLATLENKLPKHIKKYHCPCNGNNLSLQIQKIFSNSTLFYKSCKIKKLINNTVYSLPVHNETTVLLEIGWQGKAPFMPNMMLSTKAAPLQLDQGRALSPVIM